MSNARLLRVWWAMRSQKRRRALAGPPPVVPAPVIVSGFADWGRTLDGWADVVIDFTFDHTGLPTAAFELWWLRESIDVDYHRVGTVPSTRREFIQELVTSTSVFAYYRVRYVNGGVVGPFSDEYAVDV